MDATDNHGNTAMHILCGDRANIDSGKDCIAALVSELTATTVLESVLAYIVCHIILHSGVYRWRMEQDWIFKIIKYV